MKIIKAATAINEKALLLAIANFNKDLAESVKRREAGDVRIRDGFDQMAASGLKVLTRPHVNKRGSLIAYPGRGVAIFSDEDGWLYYTGHNHDYGLWGFYDSYQDCLHTIHSG